MKQENLVKPPEKACAVCGVLTGKPYGRNSQGEPLCSKKCCTTWDQTDIRERHNLRRRL